MGDNGRKLVLQTLNGSATPRIPVAPINWGFDYIWKVAGIQPWQLAFGTAETWHAAHIAYLNRHDPDAIYYSGSGGPNQPQLIEEDENRWVVKDGNSGAVYDMRKDSLSIHGHGGGNRCDPVENVPTRDNLDRLIPAESNGWGDAHLNGLSRLIADAGDRALILPHPSPAYIITCYTIGFYTAMELMLSDPELFHYGCRRMQTGEKRLMRELREAGAEAVCITDSWASCDVLSPKMVEEFALPYQHSITAAAREAGLKTIIWNCGNILPMLEAQAAVPSDGFIFEQPRKGADITVDKIRKVYGPKRCLFGNLDAELLLMRNDPEEIAAAVREQVRLSGPGAPFVLSTGSPLPSNISAEAVDAIFNAARALPRLS
ncbi:MAG TPA: uroporphyrinogen decarboxylase family protein [Candidatus Brocadiia bacterium]|nr:uroporphyrinogen decarboxylase family protein [Candidatus Brocadiia bacterium]